MLTIRNAQMAAFRKAQRAAFVRDLAARARREHPLATAELADAALARRLDLALGRALALGFVVVADQVRYALLALSAGDAAIEGAPARAVLADDAAPGRVRLDRLVALLAGKGAA